MNRDPCDLLAVDDALARYAGRPRLERLSVLARERREVGRRLLWLVSHLVLNDAAEPGDRVEASSLGVVPDLGFRVDGTALTRREIDERAAPLAAQDRV